jgi:hypothetical protein
MSILCRAWGAFPSLSGGGVSVVLFIGAQHRFKERRAHHRLRILSLEGQFFIVQPESLPGVFP